MRIGIDARLWNQTGVGRYIRNIVINLQKIDKKNEYILFVRSVEIEEIGKLITHSNFRLAPADVKWHSISEQRKFPRIIEKENVDLMHFPYFTVPYFYKKPYVVTIHDLILHHFMSGNASTLPLWLYGFKMLAYKVILNNAARKAKKIISVSNATRDEIFDHLMVNKNKVEVVYEAADDFGGAIPVKVEIKDYFLFVGNVYPHKNVQKLVEAFKKVSEENDVKLVFIGSNDFLYQRLKNDVSTLIREGKIIFKENASDSDLEGYYRNAICLVRPSLMEGFSLPPLEAVQSECIVLASDIPVHREILFDCAIYFNPKDSVDMESKMNYVLNLTKSERLNRIKEGRDLARKYSWEKAAKQTLEVYEKSIRANPN